MSYRGPGLQPARAMPGRGLGIATGGGTECPRLWRNLTLAWAPFLGNIPYPTVADGIAAGVKMPWMFGSAALGGSGGRGGTSQHSMAGGAAVYTPWGVGWSSVNNTGIRVNLGLKPQVFPNLDQCTVIIGMRKKDGVFRFANAIGQDVTNVSGEYTSINLPYGDQLIYFAWGAASITFDTTGAGHTWQQYHVYGFSTGPRGRRILIDGALMASDTGQTTRSGLGAATTFATLNYDFDVRFFGDFADYGFCYIWSEQLPDTEIARITADPGMLFRPAPRPLSVSIPFVLPIAPILPAALVIEGGDLDVISDLPGLSFGIATGLRNIGNAMARRLTTPRGGLFYDPDYGLDVRNYLNAGMTAAQLAQIQADVASEVAKDPRVENPVVVVQSNVPTSTLQITISCDLAEGPFEFVLAVSALTVDLIAVQALQ